MINVLQDALNLFFVLSVTTIAFYKYKIPIIFYIATLISISLVFLLNDVMFPATYFPDQTGYLRAAMDARNWVYSDSSPIVRLSGMIFAAFPMPVINSLASISLINKLLYIFMLVVSFKNNLLNNKCGALFFICYPTALLYTSLALRETLVLLFMFLPSYYLIIKRNVIAGLLLSIPLYLLKPQNFFIVIISFIVAMVLELVTGKMKRHKVTVFSVLFLSVMSIFAVHHFYGSKIVEKLNVTRYNMYMDDYRSDATGIRVDGIDYKGIESIRDLLLEGMNGAKNIMFRPYATEAKNVFQVVQSMENMIVMMIIVGILFWVVKHKLFDYGMFYLLTFYFLHILAYGLTVFNLGSITRFKFPFIFIFVIFSTYMIKLHRDKCLCLHDHQKKYSAWTRNIVPDRPLV